MSADIGGANTEELAATHEALDEWRWSQEVQVYRLLFPLVVELYTTHIISMPAFHLSW